MKPTQVKIVLAAMLAARQPVLITGAPGVGKSDIVAQAATEAGARLILSHPVVSDPTDYKGLPGIIDGRAEFLPFGELRKAVEATEPTIFFLDDLGQSPPSVQAACMQLLLARRVNGHHISPQVTFVAATNRRTDRAGVQGLLEPVKSRFATILPLDVDLEDWVVWALGKQLPASLISFIRYRPSLLHDFTPSADLVNSPSPRTVANIGKLMQAGLPSDVQYDVFAGAAGEGFAAEFIGYLQVAASLPRIEDIIADPTKAKITNDPAVLYALSGLVSHALMPKTMAPLCAYLNRVPPEFSIITMKDAVRLTPAICETPEFLTWTKAHMNVVF